MKRTHIQTANFDKQTNYAKFTQKVHKIKTSKYNKRQRTQITWDENKRSKYYLLKQFARSRCNSKEHSIPYKACRPSSPKIEKVSMKIHIREKAMMLTLSLGRFCRTFRWPILLTIDIIRFSKPVCWYNFKSEKKFPGKF